MGRFSRRMFTGESSYGVEVKEAGLSSEGKLELPVTLMGQGQASTGTQLNSVCYQHSQQLGKEELQSWVGWEWGLGDTPTTASTTHL